MPLLIDGHVVRSVPQDISHFIRSSSALETASKKLRDIPSKEVGPEGLLYVCQREFAVLPPSADHLNILGADDATTCHILVLRYSGSGVTGITHLDGCGTKHGIQSMLNKIKQLSHGSPEGRYEAHLVGGFLDDRGLSRKLSRQVLGVLVTLSEDVHLLTACITDLNDTLQMGIHFPVIYGLAFDLRSGELYPATFPDKGPDVDLRSASHFTASDKKIEEIFNGEFLTIGPYSWNASDCRHIVSWIPAPDEILLQNWSTSPEQEPPHFLDHMRRTMCILRDHPEPHKSLFPGGRARIYRKQSDGSWKSV